MCVTAHPDDEAGGFGGSLRLYRDRGVETCVICLTTGQAATNRGVAKNDSELSALRSKEFVAACEILRVNLPIILDYPDGQLYRQDLHRVVGDLVLNLRRFRPQVVMSFGPEGGLTGHPDHSMASIFTTLAFHWAGRTNRYTDQLQDGLTTHRPQKLYYATADFALPDRQPISFSPASAIIEIGDLLDTKVRAFKAHVTQSPLWPQFENHVRQRARREMFHLAAATTSATSSVGPESDLFAGIEDAV